MLIRWWCRYWLLCCLSERGYPCFWNLNSTVRAYFVRVNSHVNSLFFSPDSLVPIRVSVNLDLNLQRAGGCPAKRLIFSNHFFPCFAFVINSYLTSIFDYMLAEVCSILLKFTHGEKWSKIVINRKITATIMLKGRRTVSAARQTCHFVFNAIHPFLIRHETWKTTWEWQNQSCPQTNMSLKHYCQKLQTTEINFEKLLVRLTSFQQPQLQSVWIFLKFFHPCRLWYLLCYLHLLWTFLAATSMFRLIWWRFALFEFWYISWPSSF